VEFRILGPLEVTSRGERLPLGGPNQRALLALLILHANESVRRERLIDEIWGEAPPRTAAVSLNGYVSKLRKLLTNGSGASVETRPEGYALLIEPEQLDVNRFQRLVEQAREQKAEGRPEDAEETLSAALGLWRGPPLDDLAYAPFAQAEIARLEEIHVAALEDRLELEIDQGRHAAVVGELEKLASDHPLRERPVALLMLALSRSGRQAEALQAYERARRLLAEELGLEPSEMLRELQGRILRHDPDVAPVPQASRRVDAARSQMALRPRHLLIALAAAAAAAALIASIAFGGGGHGARVTANSLGVLDPATGRFISAVPLGQSPTLVAFGNGDAWVVNERGRIVSRIDGAKRRVVDNISAPAPVSGLAAAGGSIWIASSGDGRIRRIDPAYNRLDNRSTRSCEGCGAQLTAGSGALWTTDDFDTLARIAPRTGASMRAPAGLVRGAHGVAADEAGVWVAGDGVTRIDPRTLLPEGVPIPTGRVQAIAVGAHAVWAAVGNRVVEINPDDNSVEASVTVGSNPSSIAVGGGAVWVANSSDGTISRIDPAKAVVVDTIHVGPSPVGLAFGGGKLWVSAQ
jgi:YVTN family beta-propeller protein